MGRSDEEVRRGEEENGRGFRLIDAGDGVVNPDLLDKDTVAWARHTVLSFKRDPQFEQEMTEEEVLAWNRALDTAQFALSPQFLGIMSAVHNA